MAFYTAASQLNLPRTPDALAHRLAMNATTSLPSIRPGDIIHSWSSSWRQTTKQNAPSSSTSTPLTPPMTSTFQSRTASYASTQQQPPPAPSIAMEEEEEREEAYEGRPMTLPPIAHLERHIHNLPPLTPPEDIPHHHPHPHSSHARLALPKIASIHTDGYFPTKLQSQSGPMSEYDGEEHEQQQQRQHAYSHTHTHTPAGTHDDRAHLPLPPSSTSIDTSETIGVTPNTSAAAVTTIATLALAPAPTPYLVDWLDFTRTRSAHFIAEKTCEMICYLWFSIPSHARATAAASSNTSSNTSSSTTSNDAGEASHPNASATTSMATLQLVATPAFVAFMQKLLETTQVSQSVIVLSLHYIHRLKEKNQYMPAQAGSEFRIAVAGLMMANKFLDDNTYTNKTWSEVSGISLAEINRMEREFLLGVDFNLYVDKSTYGTWLNLLKGLVLAKERDARKLLRGGAGAAARRAMREREGKCWHPHGHGYGYGYAASSSSGPATRTYTSAAAAANAVANETQAAAHAAQAASASRLRTAERVERTYRHRARSTSPQAFAFTGAGAGAGGAERGGMYAQQMAHAQMQQRQMAEQAQVPYYPTSQQQQEGTVEAGAYTQAYYQQPPSGFSYRLASPTPASSTSAPYSAPETSTTGTKRSAAAAFSSPPPSEPVSAYIPHLSTTSRRPTSMYASLHSLQIPDFSATTNASRHSSATTVASGSAMSANPGMNHSPLEGLHGFERMSLGHEREDEERESGRVVDGRKAKRVRKDPAVEATNSVVPQTLVAAYSVDEARKAGVPKNLFFYSLASSPNADEKERERQRQRQMRREQSVESDVSCTTAMDAVDSEEALYNEPRARKARLRYQAAQPVKYGYDYADMNAFAARGAPLYSYGSNATANAQAYPSTFSTANANAAAAASMVTPISPVPALVPARYAPSGQYAQAHAHPMDMETPTAASFAAAQAAHAAQQANVAMRSAPTVVQSASSSPAIPMAGAVGALPHFRDDVWARPPAPARPTQATQAYAQNQTQGQAQSRWYEGQQQQQHRDEQQPMEYTASPAVPPASSPYSQQYSNPSSSHPSSTASSPAGYYHHRHRDVQSAPFANAGPPGVGAQFYATPEVQQVQVQVPGVYGGGYAGYPSYAPGVGTTATTTAPTATSAQLYASASQHSSASAQQQQQQQRAQAAYTYSGAHSTSNSPYHGAYEEYPAYGAGGQAAYGRY